MTVSYPIDHWYSQSIVYTIWFLKNTSKGSSQCNLVVLSTILSQYIARQIKGVRGELDVETGSIFYLEQVEGYREIIDKEGYKLKGKITHRRVQKGGNKVGYGVKN